MDDDAPALGPCCMCEGVSGVRNLMMLDRRGLVPGHGWGCVVCGLPSDGATAVLCDACLAAYRAGRKLRFVCRGYPAKDGRAALEELPDGAFAHDEAKHAEDAYG
jgi:hypothetical protein